jgi:hypothetical protein
MSEQPLSRAKVEEQLERESRARGFVEYPKMLHKTDGNHVIVNNKADEEDALRSADVHPTPDDAAKEKAKRDERDAGKTAVAAGAEASAKGKGGKKDDAA